MVALPFYFLPFIFILGTSLFVSALFSPAYRPPHSKAYSTSQLRLLYILPAINSSRPLPRKRGNPTHLLIVLGSGGHTAEMLSLLADLDMNSYTHRTYLISSGDEFSKRKAVDFEQKLASRSSSKIYPFLDGPQEAEHNQATKSTAPLSYSLHFVPRARKIHQSLLTAPFSSLQCFKACILFLRSPSPFSRYPNNYPDLILLNGPSTSVLILLASLFLRFFAFPGTRGKMRSIYVESWARVKGLSLSGRILVAIGAVNRVLVQWEGLAEQQQGVEYRGCLVR